MTTDNAPIIVGNTFSSSQKGNKTAIAIVEGGGADLKGHTLSDNKFVSDTIGFLYKNFDKASLAADAAGLSALNTPNDLRHGASTAGGNQLVQSGP
jgi:hypothetical protein